VPAAVMAVGAVLLIEMSYRRSTHPELGTRMRLLWMTMDSATPWPWIGALVLLAAGFVAFHMTWRRIARAWDRAGDEAGTRHFAGGDGSAR
jgi:branched-chain amino acid transport system permease protein